MTAFRVISCEKDRSDAVNRAQSTEELMALLRLAIPETVTVLEDFYDTLEDVQNLNGRFERNYE